MAKKKYLKLGNTGKAVKDLQLNLQSLGFYRDRIDGDFGPATDRAVRAFQADRGLMTDGIAGPRVFKALKSGEKDSWQLTDEAVAAAAMDLEVDVPTVRALAEVETMGDGFLEPSTPKILYERHVMYKRLHKRKMSLTAACVMKAHPNLVNTERGGYRGGKHEWARLKKALGVHWASAVEACSWGRFQIMGYHWEILGYKSSKEWMQKMSASENNHLEALVRYIKESRRLHLALRAKQWENVAYYYNGPAYAENDYHTKLAEAYERHKAAT